MTEPNLYLVGPRGRIGTYIDNILRNPNKPDLTMPLLWAPGKFVLGPIVGTTNDGSMFDVFMLSRRESYIRDNYYLTDSGILRRYKRRLEEGKLKILGSLHAEEGSLDRFNEQLNDYFNPQPHRRKTDPQPNRQLIDLKIEKILQYKAAGIIIQPRVASLQEILESLAA